MKFILFLCCLISWSISFAQNFAYQPSQSKIPSKKKFEERLENNLLADIAQLEGKVANQKEIAEIFTNRANYIRLMADEEDEYIFNTPLNQFVETTFQTLINANNFDKERLLLLVSRDMSPNASCFGEGTFVINIGLIRRLQNEDQLAFVLAHELAHYKENHVSEMITGFVEKKNDRENQKKIKKITRMKYNRNNAGLELLKDISYDSSRHSRLHEGEADEIALKMMAKAGYKTVEAIQALNRLKTVDDEKYDDEIILHKEFNRDLYPFKPEWKNEDNPLSAFFEKNSSEQLFDVDLDSLKTHPNIEKRIEYIQAKKIEKNTERISTQTQEQFENIVKQADFDYVLSAYHYKNYGQAIYQSLQLQKKYPKHPFLTGIIGACMGEMTIAIDKHELGKILPASSPEHEANYDELLSFLNNLSLTEMKEVGYNYVRIYGNQAAKSEALAYGLALTSKLKQKANEKNKYKGIYGKTFQNGYFRKQMNKVG